MNQKDFLNGIANGKKDVIQELLDLLARNKIEYCLIGGLAVNAYVEPVVSLDLDIVVAASALDSLIENAQRYFKIERFAHSVNLTSKDSDIRIQVQTDPRYQSFIKRASERTVMGYRLRVAALEDILTGKTWAYADRQRRPSKRQKDLADMLRILEASPELKKQLPETIQKTINDIG